MGPSPDNVLLDHFELARRLKLLEAHYERSMFHVHDVFMDHAQAIGGTRDRIMHQQLLVQGIQDVIPDTLRIMQRMQDQCGRTQRHSEGNKAELEAQLAAFDARLEAAMVTVQAMSMEAPELIEAKVRDHFQGSGPEIRAEILTRVKDFENNVMGFLKTDYLEMKKAWSQRVAELEDDITQRMAGAATKLAGEFVNRDVLIDSLSTQLNEISRADPLQSQDPRDQFFNISTPAGSPQKPPGHSSPQAETVPTPAMGGHGGAGGYGAPRGPWGPGHGGHGGAGG